MQRHQNRSTTVLLGAVVALLAASQPAVGASLAFSPVTIDVKAPARAGSVTVANQGAESVFLQARVIRWRQADGKTVLEPTRDAIVSPASASIPPGQSYTFRIARLGSTPVTNEDSYRLILDEIPTGDKPAPGASVVRVNLRTSLPIFFSPPKSEPLVSWRLTMTDGQLTLMATNKGSKTFRVATLALGAGEERIEFSAAGAEAYVLPGSTMTYRPAKPVVRAYPPGTSFSLTTNPAVPFAVNQPITLTGD